MKTGFSPIAFMFVAVALLLPATLSSADASSAHDKLTPASICTVTSVADSGPGTLRQCLQSAVSGDTITFDPAVFPPTSSATITLSSELPHITQGNVTVDASNAGVILDGSGAPAHTAGLHITSNANAVRGLQILRFPGHGVVISGNAQNNTVGGDRAVGSGPMGQGNLISGNGGNGVVVYGAGADHNTISGNFIGTDVSGTAAISNTSSGVTISGGASYNRIGGSTPGEGNLVSGNGIKLAQSELSLLATPQGAGTGGVRIEGVGTRYNQVLGNIIGLDASGQAALSNHEFGVWLHSGATENRVGGSTPAERNIIGGNGYAGVGIYDTATTSNTITGNYIGTDVNGTKAIGNSQGVAILGAARNRVGGASPGEGNLLSGNSSVGVGLWTGSNENIIVGNLIGTDATGSVAMGGTGYVGYGVYVSNGCASNRIGGSTPGERNIISGNGRRMGGAGVYIAGVGTVSNTVVGNYIGTDLSGTAAISNTGNGVSISGGASYNRVGGSTMGERNVISGNGSDGVGISGSDTMSNTVSGNYIGLNVGGTAAIGNSGNGVWIGKGASYNRVGGSTDGERNLVSGNGSDGVSIGDGSTTNNAVTGNYIGTDSGGTVAIGNTGNGVWLGAGTSYNRIGGSTSEEGNLISGNSGSGVSVNNALSNTVSGNVIGTDVGGTAALGNSAGGVSIHSGASNNRIGGNTPEERNVISGNGGGKKGGDGVSISGVGTMGNTVIGNSIGTNLSSTSAISNTNSGVTVSGGASYNRIGGSTTGEGNLISGNGQHGVSIMDSGTMSNTVIGNSIGTNGSGTAKTGNNNDGVKIEAPYNQVGGTAPGEGNLISGNGDNGVRITGSNARNNRVQGNLIGTDVSGAVALGNSGHGVLLGDDAQDNTIGNATTGGRNLVAGNGKAGVYIGVMKGGAGARDNLVIGNYIGTNISGTAALGNKVGVEICGDAVNNTVGGSMAGERNVIASSRKSGVHLCDGAARNRILGNYLGTDATGTVGLGNGEGVGIQGGAQQNTIGPGNLIAYNTADGVWITGTTTLSNTVTRNSIHANAGLGIDNANGGNHELTPPTITNITGGNVVIGTACAGCIVEVFSDLQDEGRVYEGSTVADASGVFTFAKGSLLAAGQVATFLTGPNLTATATDPDGNTSEFSASVALRYLYVAPGGDCGGMIPCYASVQAAVDAAFPGNEIRVATGVYTDVSVRPRHDVTDTGVVTQMVYISKTVTIRGGYTTTNGYADPPDPAANPTQLNAQGRGRVLYITGAVSPTVEGLGLCCGNAGRQGGYQAGIDVDAGGGVYIITATATLSNCEISGQADFGGGVFAYHSRAALSGNTIRYSNAGWRGGGVYLAETYNARLSANKIVNNKVFIGEGGGVAIQGGSATLSNNLIANNQSKLPYGNDLQSIQGGVATYGGGGVFVGEGDVTLSGNTIVSNTAQEKGGGIFLWESGAILQNNVVADNHAGTGGNGLAIVHNPTPGIFPRLWHNTIARNTGGDGSGLYLGGSYAGVQ
jgi:parallel beta-helix repeat protein